MVSRQQLPLPFPPPRPPSPLTHVWRSLPPPPPPCLPPLTCDRQSGNMAGATQSQREKLQSFEIPPAGRKAPLRPPECVMHYSINTNAAVWQLQDDLLVPSRPLKQTLGGIIRTKPFRRASRPQKQKHFLSLAEPPAFVCVPSRTAGIRVAKLRCRFNPTCLLHCHATPNYAPALQSFAENSGLWLMPVICLRSSTSCLHFCGCVPTSECTGKSSFLSPVPAAFQFLVPVSASL